MTNQLRCVNNVRNYQGSLCKKAKFYVDQSNHNLKLNLTQFFILPIWLVEAQFLIIFEHLEQCIEWFGFLIKIYFAPSFLVPRNSLSTDRDINKTISNSNRSESVVSIFSINGCHVMIGIIRHKLEERSSIWIAFVSFIMLNNVLFVVNNLNIILVRFSHAAFCYVQQLYSNIL